MKRIPLVAGNWKMNRTITEAREFVTALMPPLRQISGVEKVLCPPFMALFPVAALLQGTDISIGAQDLFWENSGAYTGEVSPRMIAEFCQYVIIGHSERRTYFGETDEAVKKKTLAALAAGLTPIVCIGETLTQYEENRTAEVIAREVFEGLDGFDNESARKIVVAYEPIWAIGTGRASTAENANSVVKDLIRPSLEKLYGAEISQGLRVLYGGSVTASNAAEFFHESDIDGALVGGASLKKDDFLEIVKAASEEA